MRVDDVAGNICRSVRVRLKLRSGLVKLTM